MTCRTPPISVPESHFSVTCQTPPSTVAVPRYVGNIRTPHLATPRRAKKVVDLTRRIISQQTRSIKTLQQSQNRLRTRIKKNERFINRSKSKEFNF